MAHTDRQTNTHTDGHGDSMTDPAQRAESVKNKNKFGGGWSGVGRGGALMTKTDSSYKALPIPPN